MVQVYADERLVYDTRLPDTALLGLKVSLIVNKAGTAEITMPPNHPAALFCSSKKAQVRL